MKISLLCYQRIRNDELLHVLAWKAFQRCLDRAAAGSGLLSECDSFTGRGQAFLPQHIHHPSGRTREAHGIHGEGYGHRGE